MKHWQIQDAKAKFSELIRATGTGPQHITHHGKPLAVVLSRDEFERLSRAGQSLADFMQSSPLYDLDDLKLQRDTSDTRDVPL